MQDGINGWDAQKGPRQLAGKFRARHLASASPGESGAAEKAAPEAPGPPRRSKAQKPSAAMRSMSAPPGTLGCAWIWAAAGPWSVALWQLTPSFCLDRAFQSPSEKSPCYPPTAPLLLGRRQGRLVGHSAWVVHIHQSQQTKYRFEVFPAQTAGECEGREGSRNAGARHLLKVKEREKRAQVDHLVTRPTAREETREGLRRATHLWAVDPAASA